MHPTFAPPNTAAIPIWFVQESDLVQHLAALPQAISRQAEFAGFKPFSVINSSFG